MLTDDVERYLSIRRTLGYKLTTIARQLRAFACFARDRGDTHITTARAIAWATTAASPHARHVRMRTITRLARFLHVEDPMHEVASQSPFRTPIRRSMPYIYAPDEIARIVAATARLYRSYPLRRQVYGTLLGLIAATGLRVSEALNLRLDDVLPDGALRIRHTKFGKSRLVPLHPTVRAALGRYLDVRKGLAVTDDHVFLSARDRRVAASTVNATFRRILTLANIAPDRTRVPRIHDLRHTFATRALEKCGAGHGTISRHFVALSTYLGHVDVRSTYWYLEATPELMTGLAATAETLAMGGAR